MPAKPAACGAHLWGGQEGPASTWGFRRLFLLPDPDPDPFLWPSPAPPHSITVLLHIVSRRRMCFNFPETLQMQLPILDFFPLLIALTHFMLKYGRFGQMKAPFKLVLLSHLNLFLGQRPLREL